MNSDEKQELADLREEVGRCHRLLLARTGSTSTEPLDAILGRWLDLVQGHEDHHEEHHRHEVAMQTVLEAANVVMAALDRWVVEDRLIEMRRLAGLGPSPMSLECRICRAVGLAGSTLQHRGDCLLTSLDNYRKLYKALSRSAP